MFIIFSKSKNIIFLIIDRPNYDLNNHYTYKYVLILFVVVPTFRIFLEIFLGNNYTIKPVVYSREIWFS